MRLISALATILGLMVSLSPAMAQEPEIMGLPVGSFLRITATTRGSQRVAGTVVGMEDGFLVLQMGRGTPTRRIDLSSVSRIEIRKDCGKRGLAFAVRVALGGGLGAMAGAALSLGDQFEDVLVSHFRPGRRGAN